MNASLQTQDSRKPLIMGWALMTPALMAWCFMLVQGLTGTAIFSSTFGALDNVSGIFTVLIMFLLPAIAVLINLIPIVNFNLKKDGQELTSQLNLKLSPGHLLLIALAVLNVGILLVFFVFENFMIVPTH